PNRGRWDIQPALIGESPMRRILVALPLIALLAFAALFGRGFLMRGEYGVAAGQEMDPPAAFTDGRPNLVAAAFYSAWCSSCAVLEPKMRAVAPRFEGRAVEFVKIDFSLGQPDSLEARAVELGFDTVYRANKGATGFVALVDRRTQSVIDTIVMTQSEDDIESKIETAILNASKPIVTLGG
ncbi:MAG: thioredoxin domain-containing protein, partial [Pseudomonadota bacterium]